MKISTRITVGVICVLVAACSTEQAPQSILVSTTGPDFTGPAPTLTIDRTEYSAVPYLPGSREQQYVFNVVATFTNNSDQILYLGTCPRYSVRADVQPTAYSGQSACSGGMPGILVPAHSIRIDTLRVTGPNTFDGHTGAGFGLLDGNLILSYGVATCLQPDLCNHVKEVDAPKFSVHAIQ